MKGWDILVAGVGTELNEPGWESIGPYIEHGQCRCISDGRISISYVPPTPKDANKRPWHKHTLPRRKGSKR